MKFFKAVSFFLVLICLDENISQVFAGANCPAGWTERSGICYKFLSSSCTWSQAKQACANNKQSELLTVRSDSEAAKLKSLWTYLGLADEKIWLGYTDARKEGTYEDIKGHEPTSPKWDRGQPRNFCGLEDCAVINKDGYWSARKCSEMYRYVCQIVI